MMSQDFERGIHRHQCYRVDSGTSNSSKVYEIIQFPLLKTSDRSEGETLLSLSMKVVKANSIQLECDIDRSLELTYCASDILEVLVSPK